MKIELPSIDARTAGHYPSHRTLAFYLSIPLQAGDCVPAVPTSQNEASPPSSWTSPNMEQAQPESSPDAGDGEELRAGVSASRVKFSRVVESGYEGIARLRLRCRMVHTILCGVWAYASGRTCGASWRTSHGAARATCGS